MARYTGNSIKTTVSTLRYLPGQRPSLEISVRKLIRFPGPRCLLARLTVYEWYLQEKETRVGATPSLGINPAADRRPVKEQPVVASRVRPREKNPGAGGDGSSFGRSRTAYMPRGSVDGVAPCGRSSFCFTYMGCLCFFYNEYALILSVTARVAERMPYNMYFEKLPTAIISLM